MRTITSTLYACLLVLCVPVAASESDAGTESTNKAATDTADDQGTVDMKHEDIVDRVFSPLDNAVSDINRDLNEGDVGAASESSE